MNLIINLLVTLGFWWTDPSRHSSSDRPAAELTHRVHQSLQTGSTGDLADCFDKRIELLIDTEGINFPSANATQAEQALKSFFRKHPPRNFTYAHQGSADSFRYSTGTYASLRESYQVYILMRRSSHDNYIIYSLHLRKK